MKIHYISTNIISMIMLIMLLTFSNTNLSYPQSNTNSLTFVDPLSGVQFKYTDELVKEGF